VAVPPSPDADNDPADQLKRALALVAEQDWRAAAALFADAKHAYEVAAKPRSAAGAAIGLANCLSEMRDLPTAREILRTAAGQLADNDPLLTTVRANLAVCLARGGDLDEAERLWQNCFERYLD
jgi:tetratricopeptide (TPR) repeat protein